jgi:hypothetical protein
MWLLLTVACAIHTSRTGLVEPAGSSLALRTYDGKAYHLVVDEDGEPLRYAGKAVVVVEGPRFGRTLVVHDWHVRDAGDGNAGFVGVLRTYGSRLVIDDRNSATTLVIDDRTAPQLLPWVGKTVLIMGPVVGKGTIDVVAFRVLAEDGKGAANQGDERPPGR